jgi:excisionase family DNA binding protein
MGRAIAIAEGPRRLADCGDVLSPRELAQVLNLGRDGTYALLSARRIASVRVGQRLLVPRLAVERFLLEVLEDTAPPAPNGALARTSEERSDE